MTDLLTLSERLLTASGYELMRLSGAETPSLAFESETILGFMHVYDTPVNLLACWPRDYENAIQRFSFAFRRAEEKAWNAYAVFLATADPDSKTAHALHAIEEDLSATRKIARAGLHTSEDVNAALLPLLPLQNAPRLEAVDISSEIRERAQDVPKAALDAFLDSRPEEDVIQLLEDEG